MKKCFSPLLVIAALLAPPFLVTSLLAQPAPGTVPAPNGTPTPEPTETPQPTPAPPVTPAPTATPRPTPQPVIAPQPADPKPVGATRRAKLIGEKAVRVEAELLEDTTRDALNARFTIAPDGSATVTLLDSSGSRRVDEIVRKQISAWRFAPALQNGTPIASAVKLRVEFR